MSIFACGFLKDKVFDPLPAPVLSKKKPKKPAKVVMKCRRIFEKMPYGATVMFADLGKFNRPLRDGTITWVNLWDPDQDLRLTDSSGDESADM